MLVYTDGPPILAQHLLHSQPLLFADSEVPDSSYPTARIWTQLTTALNSYVLYVAASRELIGLMRDSFLGHCCPGPEVLGVWAGGQYSQPPDASPGVQHVHQHTALARAVEPADHRNREMAAMLRAGGTSFLGCCLQARAGQVREIPYPG